MAKPWARLWCFSSFASSPTAEHFRRPLALFVNENLVLRWINLNSICVTALAVLTLLHLFAAQMRCHPPALHPAMDSTSCLCWTSPVTVLQRLKMNCRLVLLPAVHLQPQCWHSDQTAFHSLLWKPFITLQDHPWNYTAVNSVWQQTLAQC